MSNYTASDIKVLEGLEAVRMRPGMYIGSTGSRGLHHMLWEIVDNAIDEAANGYANTVTITIHKDASVTVEDNGRGIPVGIQEQKGVSGVEVVFTHLHAGGKFDDDNYSYSGGLHGVGASVVNALSEWLHVEIYYQSKVYKQEYASVMDKATGKIEAGKPLAPLAEIGRTRRQGTSVTFRPDPRVFETLDWNFETIEKRARELSFLNLGVKLTITDERVRPADVREFVAVGGISDFVRYLNNEKTCVHKDPIVLEGIKDGIRIKAAIQYNDGYTESLFSYVNNIPTSEGGTHETGFKTAFTKALNDYCRRIGALKDKDSSLSGEDFREGITVVLSLQMKNVQFEGQTKTKLGNTEARTAVEAIVLEQLSVYFEDLRNCEVAATITDKALKAAKVREAARKAKTLAREKNKLENAPLVGKLSSCSGRNSLENELFIVEGDSAGGSAKQGRDRRFQAILPLRGKPLNAEKKRLDQVLANEEFRSIITALGTGIGEDFNIAGLKYDKIVILSDADQDGAHIRAILLTFFFRYMKELVIEGHVYIGMPPLYRVMRGKEFRYCYDEIELNAASKAMGKGYTVQRYKGLGEMNAEQLWETTLNPQGRSLIRVQIDDAAEADRIVTILMGDKVDPRKDYISRYANFNKKDNFAGREV